MKKIICLALFVSVSLLGVSQVKVYPLAEVDAKNVKGESFVYLLPITTLKVTVYEVKVTEVKGYYSDYSESLLGLSNCIKENRSYYELGGIEVEPITTADPNNSFMVVGKNLSSLKEKFKKNLSINQKSGLEIKSYRKKTAKLPDFFYNYADISYTQQSQAFVETKIIDGVVTQVPASHTKVVSKSFEQKARQAADAIVKCREDQYLLVAGDQETAYSGDAIKTMVEELKTWEDNYMSLFTGVRLYDTVCHIFYITPTEDLDEVQLFNFSSEKGLNSLDQKFESYSLKLNKLYNTSKISNSLKRLTSDTDFSNYLRYRNLVPVRAELNLNGKTLFDYGFFEMYQFSEIQLLPVNLITSNIESVGFIY